MGGPNPKYKTFDGLWVIRFAYDHDAGCDCVEAVFPITSPTSYWTCDIDRFIDVYESEEAARNEESRVRAKHKSALKYKADLIAAENEDAEQKLRRLFGNLDWFQHASQEDIAAVAAHLAEIGDWRPDETWIRSLFGLE